MNKLWKSGIICYIFFKNQKEKTENKTKHQGLEERTPKGVFFIFVDEIKNL